MFGLLFGGKNENDSMPNHVCFVVSFSIHKLLAFFPLRHEIVNRFTLNAIYFYENMPIHMSSVPSACFQFHFFFQFSYTESGFISATKLASKLSQCLGIY